MVIEIGPNLMSLVQGAASIGLMLLFFWFFFRE
jgi:hypothetical protein